MKNSKIYILSILTIFTLFSCSGPTQNLENKCWKQAMKSQKLEDFLTYAVNFPNSKRIDYCVKHMDSLVKLKPYTILSGYSPDSMEYPIIVRFHDLQGSDYYLKKRNAFILTVTDSGLYHNGKPLKGDIFFKKIRGFQEYHWSEKNYPQSKEVYNKYFGTVLVSKVCFVIETDKKEFKTSDKIDWKLYLKTLRLVRDSYLKIWNEKANLIWGKNFKDLEYAKKKAITNTTVLRIEVDFLKRKFGLFK